MTDTDRQTLTNFIAAEHLTMRAERTSENPVMEQDRRFPMDHWKCYIRRSSGDGRRQLTITFSMGHGKEPEISGVLDYLASDASSYDQAQGFEDWCRDFGYDADSRKAERTYRAVERAAERLKRFLGDDAYERLLYHTERE